MSNRHLHGDLLVWVVTNELEIFEGEAGYVLLVRVDLQHLRPKSDLQSPTSFHRRLALHMTIQCASQVNLAVHTRVRPELARSCQRL